MSTAQRVSRGFHRLGFFLAAILLVIGTGASIFIAIHEANAGKLAYDEQLALACAQELAKAPQTRPVKDGEVTPLTPGKYPWEIAWQYGIAKGAKTIEHVEQGDDDPTFDLRDLHCSDRSRTVAWHQIIDAPVPEHFSYTAKFLIFLSSGLAISLGLALVVYVLVRAIGWVIGGFAAS